MRVHTPRADTTGQRQGDHHARFDDLAQHQKTPTAWR
jgi:hypothetical protein